MSTDRTTKYVYAVREHIQQVGHATNGELLAILRARYPDLSATTIHRITARMHERGELQLAPSGAANNLRYDANTEPHDHFMCEVCGVLRDATLSGELRPLIEQAIGDGCSISGSLTVSGICKHCKAAQRNLL
jgi:Fur family peroxide stress response transcriptional regulator